MNPKEALAVLKLATWSRETAGLEEAINVLDRLMGLMESMGNQFENVGRTGHIRLDVEEVWQIDDAFRAMQKAGVEGPMMDVYDKLDPALNVVIIVMYEDRKPKDEVADNGKETTEEQ